MPSKTKTAAYPYPLYVNAIVQRGNAVRLLNIKHPDAAAEAVGKGDMVVCWYSKRGQLMVGRYKAPAHHHDGIIPPEQVTSHGGR